MISGDALWQTARSLGGTHGETQTFEGSACGVRRVRDLQPEGETVPVEFMPSEPGEYEFACQMGMFRGQVLVE